MSLAATGNTRSMKRTTLFVGRPTRPGTAPRCQIEKRGPAPLVPRGDTDPVDWTPRRRPGRAYGLEPDESGSRTAGESHWTRLWVGGSRLRPGSFGSPGADKRDGLGSVLGEVFEAFDRPEAEAPDHGEGGVAEGGEHLGGVAGAGAALVLAAGDVPDRVRPVLDAPMSPNPVEQGKGWQGPLRHAVVATA